MRQVIALAVLSAANGLFEATFATRLGDLGAVLHLSPAALGALPAAFSGGLLLGGALTVALLSRLGPRALMLIAVCVACLPLLAIGLGLGHLTAVEIGLLWCVSGVGIGILDPVHASVAVAIAGRRLALHGLLALKMGATAFAALMSALLIAQGVSPQPEFVAVAALCLSLGLVAAVWLPVRDPGFGPETAPTPAVRAGVWGLIAVGLLAAAAVVPVGVALNFAGLIAREAGTPVALEGAAAVAFTLAQAVSFAAAWWLSAHLRASTQARLGTLCAALGAGALLLAHLVPGVAVPAVVSGFLAVGAGLAPVIPLAQRAAHRLQVARLSPARALAVLVTIQYASQSLGPLAVGAVGEHIGITLAFVAVTGICGAVLGAAARRLDSSPL